MAPRMNACQFMALQPWCELGFKFMANGSVDRAEIEEAVGATRLFDSRLDSYTSDDWGASFRTPTSEFLAFGDWKRVYIQMQCPRCNKVGVNMLEIVFSMKSDDEIPSATFGPCHVCDFEFKRSDMEGHKRWLQAELRNPHWF